MCWDPSDGYSGCVFSRLAPACRLPAPRQVQGFLAAMTRLDEVVDLVRSSASTTVARAALIESIGLSAEQADGVLGLTLRCVVE
eukprot:366227-Chlamydomonas_euryale.AAC.7